MNPVASSKVKFASMSLSIHNKSVDCNSPSNSNGDGNVVNLDTDTTPPLRSSLPHNSRLNHTHQSSVVIQPNATPLPFQKSLKSKLRTKLT